jgi:hypothetical protein
MKKTKYILVIAAVFALSAGVFAGSGTQSAPAVKPDSAVVQSVAASAPKSSSSSQNKQAGVVKNKRSTNWSKIKTLFE